MRAQREVALLARRELLEPEASAARRRSAGGARRPRPREQRLAPARTVAIDAPTTRSPTTVCGIALEELVRERRQQVEGIAASRRSAGSARSIPSTRPAASRSGGRSFSARRTAGGHASSALELREHLVAARRIAQDVLEELLDVEHLVRHEPQHLAEPPVLLARRVAERGCRRRAGPASSTAPSGRSRDRARGRGRERRRPISESTERVMAGLEEAARAAAGMLT